MPSARATQAGPLGRCRLGEVFLGLDGRANHLQGLLDCFTLLWNRTNQHLLLLLLRLNSGNVGGRRVLIIEGEGTPPHIAIRSWRIHGLDLGLGLERRSRGRSLHVGGRYDRLCDWLRNRCGAHWLLDAVARLRKSPEGKDAASHASNNLPDDSWVDDSAHGGMRDGATLGGDGRGRRDERNVAQSKVQHI